MSCFHPRASSAIQVRSAFSTGSVHTVAARGSFGKWPTPVTGRKLFSTEPPKRYLSVSNVAELLMARSHTVSRSFRVRVSILIFLVDLFHPFAASIARSREAPIQISQLRVCDFRSSRLFPLFYFIFVSNCTRKRGKTPKCKLNCADCTTRSGWPGPLF